MNDDKIGLKVPLFTDNQEPESYELYIYGDDPENDSFGKALKRYVDEIGFSQAQLSSLTGISRSAIYNYYNDLRKINYDYLLLLCVALRLHPMRQEYLFSFTPHTLRKSDDRYFIIRPYLDGCAFMEGCTVIALNEKLTANDKTPLISKKRSSGNE